MNTLPDLVRAVLAKLAEFLGLRKSEQARLEAQRRALLGLRRTLNDELDNLKTDIHVLEQRALKLKQEFDQTKGEGKRVIIEQIELAREELDGQKGRQDILVSRISNVNTALAKLDELEAARKRGVGQEVLDDIAVDLDGALADLKDEDKAARDLKRVQYQRERKPVTETVRPEAMDVVEPPAKEALSEDTAKWLKQLETEEE